MVVVDDELVDEVEVELDDDEDDDEDEDPESDDFVLDDEESEPLDELAAALVLPLDSDRLSVR